MIWGRVPRMTGRTGMTDRKTLGELIEEEYTGHDPGEDDEVYWIKEALVRALNPLERKIYVTYLERGTYAATAKAFKVSTPTLAKYVNNHMGPGPD